MFTTLADHRTHLADLAALRAFTLRAASALGEVEQFREAAKWTRHGDKWTSSGGRVLSDASYQRLQQRLTQRKAGTAERSTLASSPEVRTFAPAHPIAELLAVKHYRSGDEVEPPAGPDVLGAAGRVAAAVARRVGTAGRAIKSVPAKLGARSAKAGAWASGGVEAIGTKAKRLKGLERRLGIGAAIEKSGKRAVVRSQAIEKAFGQSWLHGNRVAVREATRAMGNYFKESRRKYGALAAIAIEGTMLAVGLTKGALFTTLGAAASLHIPGAGRVLGQAVKYTRLVVTPLIRKAVEYPFKTVARISSATSRNLAAAGRLAQKMDARGMVAGPGLAIGRARDIRRGTGPGNLYPEAGGTSRSGRFAERDEAEPAEMVATLRRHVNTFRASIGQPPTDATDDQLGGMLSQVMDRIEEMASEPAGTFAERRVVRVPESSYRLAESLGWVFAESTSPILGDMTARIQSISQILARVRPLAGHIVRHLAQQASEKLPAAIGPKIKMFITVLGSERDPSTLFEAFDTLFDTISTLPPAERQVMVQRLVGVAGSLRGLSKGDPARGVTLTEGRSAVAVGEAMLGLLKYFSPTTVARK